MPATGRGHIEKRADAFGFRKGVRDRIDEPCVGGSYAFLHHCAKAADEIYICLCGGVIERLCKIDGRIDAMAAAAQAAAPRA